MRMSLHTGLIQRHSLKDKVRESLDGLSEYKALALVRVLNNETLSIQKILKKF